MKINKRLSPSIRFLSVSVIKIFINLLIFFSYFFHSKSININKKHKIKTCSLKKNKKNDLPDIHNLMM